MAKEKHVDLILQHMKKYGSINHMEALSEYGCARLASRINDLRKRGVAIETEIVKGKNRYGETTHYAVYRLAVTEE